MKTWQETVIDDREIEIAKAVAEKLSLSHKAHPRYEKEKVLLEAQAEIAFKAGVKRVVRSLAPHYEEGLDGVYRQNGWWLPDDIWQSIKNGG